MKALTILFNGLRMLFRVRVWLMFTIFAPLIFTLVLGLATGGNSADDPRLSVLVVDQDGGPVASDIVAQIRRSSVVELGELTDEASARQAVKARWTNAALILPQGLSAAISAGEQGSTIFVANPASSTRIAVEQEFTAILGRVSGAYDIARIATEQAAQRKPFGSPADRDAYFADVLSSARAQLAAPVVTVRATQPQAAARPGEQIATGYNQSSAGAAVQWVMTGAMSTAGFIALERQRGTLRRLMIMPVTRMDVLLGNGLLGFCISVIQIVVVVGFGALLGANWGKDIPALLLVIGSYSLSMSGLAMLFATLAKSQGQAIGFGVALANVAAPLAGAWFPRELLPPAMLALGKLFPSGWAMEAFTGVIVRSWHLADVLVPCAVMLLFAVAFLGVGVRRFQFE
jgi:ABC-2 type transport system permease protein